MNARAEALREEQVRLGLWMFLATVTMLFAAFTSAYIVRRAGSDWHAVALPSILWWNTAALAASSLAVEWAERAGRQRRWTLALAATLAALKLGFVFLAGQVVAWREMTQAGVYLQSNPHSSFFFMMTGAHAAHIVAALAVLGWGAVRTWRAARDPQGWPAAFGLARTFWHFLGFVWVFLFALVSLV